MQFQFILSSHEGDHHVDHLVSLLGGQRKPGQHRTSQDETPDEEDLLRGIERPKSLHQGGTGN